MGREYGDRFWSSEWRDSRIRLQPANSVMDPIYVKDCIVQGVVRAVIRKFQPV